MGPLEANLGVSGAGRNRSHPVGAKADHRVAAHAPWRRALPVLLAAALCAGAAPVAEAQCAGRLQRAFEAAARAQRKTVSACVDRLDPGTPGFSVGACADGDPFGWVERAAQRAARAEAALCDGPEIGRTAAATLTAAARAAAPALARGLFGRDLDAGLRSRAADAAGAQCQRLVLDRAQRCAARAVHRYTACSARALRGTVDDPFDLVACKPLPAGQCDSRIAHAIANHCAGLDLTALFPGCAGDLTRCVRAHAERSASQAINRAAGLCADVLIGTLPEDTLLRCFAPPAREPVRQEDVPLPAGVRPTSVQFDDSGEWLTVGFHTGTGSGTELAVVRPDGSGFRCLTCDHPRAANLEPVQLLRDGRRVLVAGPNNANPKWYILECAPSLLDCAGAELVPIELPPNPDPTTPILQYRVPWVSLDDAWLIWSEVRLRGPGGTLSAIGRLVRGADRYTVADARVFSPPLQALSLGTDAAAWQLVSQPNEAKYGALRGGRDWVEAATPNAGQYDALTIDLASGAVRRLTHDPDHDEGLRYSRDEQWFVVQSTRTDNRIGFLGLLPRPPFIDWIAFSLHFVAIAGQPGDGISPGGDRNERDCYADPWLIDRWFERGDYLGQPLSKPADGWESISGNATGFGWSPDGTAVAHIEARWRRLTPPGERPETRLRIARLPNRPPIDPADVVPLVATPEPTWAVRYEDWIVPNTFGVAVIPGKASGTATVTNDFANTLSGSARVAFSHYSDDGVSFLDGFEEIRIPMLVLNGAEYEVDLTLSGAHTGSMRGALEYDFDADVNRGEVVSVLDGQTLSGPKTCYAAGLLPVP